MKKLLSLICVLSIAFACSACGKEKSSSMVSYENTINEENTIEETTITETSQETTAFDYRVLSNEEFAEKIAKDFSTEDVTFTIEKYDEDMYFLNTNNENVRAHIGFSDYGNNITLTLVTDGGEDECYYVLLKALQSEVFSIPLDDQIDILAHYTVDEIDYEKGSLRITESVNDNISVIGIRL